MENENNDRFDLHMLLRFGDLDIRGKAANNVLAAEYFSLLSEFANQAQQFESDLIRIADIDADDAVFENLGNSKALLESIGCKKFIPEFNDIIKAKNCGDMEFAASFAKNVTADFSIFCTRVQNARKPGKSDGGAEVLEADDQGSANTSSSYGMYTLKKVLQLLGNEDATRKLRVLAIDDAPVTLKIISSALGNDYKVYGMTNPKLVEPFLQQITPELFILDYRMPDLSGFDLIPIIRSFEEHKTTPIIFLTSMGTIDHISAAVKLGACDYIVKPFHAEILREKVAKHIVRKVLL